MTNERPAKRRRTTTSSVFDTRKADPDVHEDVDTLIVDYVIHGAIRAIFRERDAHISKRDEAVSRSDTHLSLVESFLTVFKSQHAGAAVSETISFRLALLRFEVLFTRRGHSYASGRENKHTAIKKDTRDEKLLVSRDLSQPSVSALAALRKQNSRRAHRWHQGSQLQPVTVPDVSNAGQYRDAPMRARKMESPNKLVNSDVRLLDLIPSFISLTKRRARLAADDWETSQQWLELAADFMLLAAAESSSAENKEPDKFVKEAFAWGPLARPSDHESGAMAIDGTVDPPNHDLQHENENDIFLVKPRSRSHSGPDANSIGESSREEAAALWYRIRASRIATSLKQGPVDVLRSGEYRKFVRSMREYTSALAESVSAPLLSQLEDAAVAERQGKPPKVELDGEMLSAEETRCLLRLWIVDLRSPRMAQD